MMKGRSFTFFQTIGWLLFGAINFFSRAAMQGVLWSEFVSTSVLVVIAWAVSSGLRRFYRRSITSQVSLIALVSSVILASLVAGVLCTLLIFVALEPFASTLYDTETIFTTVSLVSNIINLSLVMLIWSSLYFVIKRYHKYEQMKADKQQLDAALKQVSLESLISQLNPHFMFNTINNIRALILEDTHKARDMLSHLADMYRYTLNSQENHLVTLAEELTMIDDYLALMDIQLEGRLQTEFEVETQSKAALLPRMMLQLLVENAIKYGIATKKSGGKLVLIAKRDKDHLFLQVRNSGSIQAQKQDSTGLGLKNIKQRLDLLYADKASITMKNEHSQVVVSILIPWSTTDVDSRNR
ncbi:histidine kinase [Aliiglaciecola sp. LCG003]|uniref:sensor histidine kinase n=1 Tax=Aliiglaciecola sp. LCG003 TaxID=3053655 RepID=UPI0025743137|nr:histidine kinase [Aliiglaciecola sp. LCG003]WJG08693.1 histidine kinase [Aliiglaciecola sp. LCG003]